jgi:uncharacterized phage infection (PIP) family protein YhgE
MTEVVSSIRRVTDIMGEISAASNEQSAGVAQVGEAVMSMDQTTQQNAALVEEMAAAASSLSSQAQNLVQVVSVFKLSEGQHTVSKAPAPVKMAAPPKAIRQPAPAPAAKRLAAVPVAAKAPSPTPAPKAAALPKPAPRAVSAGGDDDWETF